MGLYLTSIGFKMNQMYDMTDLMGAASVGHTENVRRYLKQDQDVNARRGNGRTALMYAATTGCSVEVVEILGYLFRKEQIFISKIKKEEQLQTVHVGLVITAQ